MLDHNRHKTLFWFWYISSVSILIRQFRFIYIQFTCNLLITFSIGNRQICLSFIYYYYWLGDQSVDANPQGPLNVYFMQILTHTFWPAKIKWAKYWPTFWPKEIKCVNWSCNTYDIAMLYAPIVPIHLAKRKEKKPQNFLYGVVLNLGSHMANWSWPIHIYHKKS